MASFAYFFTRNSQAGSTKDVRYVASSAEAHLTFRFNLCRRDGATCLSRIQQEADKDFVVEEYTKNFCKSLSPVLGANKNISWCESITFVLETIFSFRKDSGLLAGQKIYHRALFEASTIRV